MQDHAATTGVQPPILRQTRQRLLNGMARSSTSSAPAVNASPFFLLEVADSLVRRIFARVADREAALPLAGEAIP